MNSFGRFFRISLFGESHGPLIGVSIDGCKPGISLTENDFREALRRRQAGAPGTTPRVEADEPKLVSGVYRGFTTGAPLTILFENLNVRSEDYNQMKKQPRPGHADWVAMKKFDGFNDPRGGGHFSGRLTLALVAAGVVASKMLAGISINAKLTEAGGQADIKNAVTGAIESNDSIGGIVECRVSGVPAGLGEPFFDSVEAVIAHLAFSIPAVKGIEFGSGFAAARMKGSEHNDPILDHEGTTLSNHSGGINGGITNGNELVYRVAIKPTSSTAQPQQTLNLESGKVEELRIAGRHDACIALRVPVVLESITAIVLADLLILA